MAASESTSKGRRGENLKGDGTLHAEKGGGNVRDQMIIQTDQ